MRARPLDCAVAAAALAAFVHAAPPVAGQWRPTVRVEFELEAAAYRAGVTEARLEEFQQLMQERMLATLGARVGFIDFVPEAPEGTPSLRVRLVTDPPNAPETEDLVPTKFELALTLRDGGQAFVQTFEFRPAEDYRHEIAYSQLVEAIPNRFEAVVLADRLLGGLLSRISVLPPAEDEAPAEGFFAAWAGLDGKFEGVFVLPSTFEDYAALPPSKFEIERSVKTGAFGSARLRTRLVGSLWPQHLDDLRQSVPASFRTRIFTREDPVNPDVPRAQDAKYVGLNDLWERMRPPGEPSTAAPADGFLQPAELAGLYIAFYVPNEESLSSNRPPGLAQVAP